MSSLHHPGVMRLFDYGRIAPEVEVASQELLRAGCPYLVMELAAVGLHHYCAQMSWPLLYSVQMALLDTLSYIHARGILHCDIKPSNLLITHHLKLVKLSDFGISCEFSQLAERYRKGRFLGTPSYMAPEQFNRNWRDHGPWTDLYAFGCTMVELLSGEPPFGHKKSLDAIKKSHLFETPVLPEPAFDVPPGYVQWLGRMLAKDPADRFQLAADAAWELQALQEAAPETFQTDLLESFEGSLPLKQGLALADLPTLIETQPIHTFSTTSIPATNEKQEVDPAQGTDEAPDTALESLVTQTDLPSLRSLTPRPKLSRRPCPEEFPVRERRFNPATPPTLSQALRESLAPPFLGRHKERQQLWDTLRQTIEAQKPHLLLIEGAPGVGKSRLAEWLLQSAQQTGVAAGLRVSCHQEQNGAQSLCRMLRHTLRSEGLQGQALVHQISTCMSAMEPCIDPLDATQKTRAMRTFPWQSLAEWIETHTKEASPLDTSPSLAINSFEPFEIFLMRLCEYRPVILWLDQPEHAPELLQWWADWYKRLAASLPLLLVTTFTTLPGQREAPRRWLPQSIPQQRCELAPLPSTLQEELLAHWPLQPEERAALLEQSEGHLPTLLRHARLI